MAAASGWALTRVDVWILIATVAGAVIAYLTLVKLLAPPGGYRWLQNCRAVVAWPPARSGVALDLDGQVGAQDDCAITLIQGGIRWHIRTRCWCGKPRRPSAEVTRTHCGISTSPRTSAGTSPAGALWPVTTKAWIKFSSSLAGSSSCRGARSVLSRTMFLPMTSTLWCFIPAAPSGRASAGGQLRPGHPYP